MDTQKCKKCNMERVMDYFPLLVKGKNGAPDKYKKTCFGCAYNDPEYDPFKRVCCDCGYRKDKDNFYVRGGRLDYKCIECVKKKSQYCN